MTGLFVVLALVIALAAFTLSAITYVVVVRWSRHLTTTGHQATGMTRAHARGVGPRPLGQPAPPRPTGRNRQP